MRLRERQASLAERLRWTLAAVATCSAIFATAASMLLTDALIRRSVEESVLSSAQVLASEIDEDPAFVDELDQELEDLGIEGRAAVIRGGHVVAGDLELSVVDGDGCQQITARTAVIVCAVPLHSDPSTAVALAWPVDRLIGHREPMTWAAIVIVGLMVVLARVVGTIVARRSVGPLERLEQAVVEADPAAPAAIVLPPASGLREIDALRHALAQLLGRLDVELTGARRFAANAAHELRTPLAKLRAGLELARETDPTSAELGERLGRLERTAIRLAALTERLLLLATPGEALATEHCTSMSQLVEELAYRSSDERSRLRLDVCVSDALVRGDEVLLASVLDNAVENALKFSDGPVYISVSCDDQQVIVDVADEGPGVPPQLEREVFTPFARAESARGRPGHGLGLALVAHVVAAYGGEVEFVRDRGPGACLRIFLPFAGARRESVSHLTTA